ncbi:hypothetical protein HDU97_007373 [Phlyctochytrium planicorne]|nr:hypothetical protein HDU97_007373 [Phlyctochytrium planicorne]
MKLLAIAGVFLAVCVIALAEGVCEDESHNHVVLDSRAPDLFSFLERNKYGHSSHPKTTLRPSAKFLKPFQFNGNTFAGIIRRSPDESTEENASFLDKRTPDGPDVKPEASKPKPTGKPKTTSKKPKNSSKKSKKKPKKKSKGANKVKKPKKGVKKPKTTGKSRKPAKGSEPAQPTALASRGEHEVEDAADMTFMEKRDGNSTEDAVPKTKKGKSRKKVGKKVAKKGRKVAKKGGKKSGKKQLGKKGGKNKGVKKVGKSGKVKPPSVTPPVIPAALQRREPGRKKGLKHKKGKKAHTEIPRGKRKNGKKGKQNNPPSLFSNN